MWTAGSCVGRTTIRGFRMKYPMIEPRTRVAFDNERRSVSLNGRVRLGWSCFKHLESVVEWKMDQPVLWIPRNCCIYVLALGTFRLVSKSQKCSSQLVIRGWTQLSSVTFCVELWLRISENETSPRYKEVNLVNFLNKSRTMSRVRIPYRSASVLPSGIPPLNLFRLLAHSPSTFGHSLSLGTVSKFLYLQACAHFWDRFWDKRQLLRLL